MHGKNIAVSKVEGAVRWLDARLSPGVTAPAGNIIRDAEAQGPLRTSLMRARWLLGIDTTKAAGWQSRWHWQRSSECSEFDR
jgi:hypothetical protein